MAGLLKYFRFTRRVLMFAVSAMCVCFILQVNSPVIISVYRQHSQEDHLVIRSAVITAEEYLRLARVNDSEKEDFEKSLREFELFTSKTYKLSLTEQEQRNLENSPAAREIRFYAHTGRLNYSEDWNLLEKGPFPFLAEFKNPCWYNKLHELRCLPYFFVIGCPKCGSTDLYKMLTAHPEFVAPKFRKGFNWLTRTRFKGFYDFEWYTTNIGQPLSRRFLNSLESDSDPVELSDSFSAKGDRVSRRAIVGDCSTSTMWDNDRWPIFKENILPLEPTFTIADYIYFLYPKTKIVAILRNPITRLYSDYMYFDKPARRGPHHFHRDVIQAVRHFSTCFEEYSIRSCVYNRQKTVESTPRVRLWVGVYFIHLLEWYRVFPREQIHIIRFEDYAKSRTESVRELYDFLTLSKFTDDSAEARFIEQSNSSNTANAEKRSDYKSSQMFEETRFILYTFYKPFNQELARMLNDQRFDFGPY